MSIPYVSRLLVFVMCLALQSCGGGGGDASSAQVPPAASSPVNIRVEAFQDTRFQVNPTDRVPVGQTFTFQATVSNLGPSTASAVNLSARLGPNLVLLGITCGSAETVAACPTGLIENNVIPALPNGSGLRIQYRVQPVQTISFTANLELSASAAGDTDLGDNGFRFARPVWVADLAVSASGPTRTLAGQDAVYTVQVSNLGPDTADNLALSATSLPGFPQAQAVGSSCILIANPAISGNCPLSMFTGQSLAAGSALAIVYTVRTPANQTATLQTRFEVGQIGDLNLANNATILQTQVVLP